MELAVLWTELTPFSTSKQNNRTFNPKGKFSRADEAGEIPHIWAQPQELYLPTGSKPSQQSQCLELCEALSVLFEGQTSSNQMCVSSWTDRVPPATETLLLLFEQEAGFLWEMLWQHFCSITAFIASEKRPTLLQCGYMISTSLLSALISFWKKDNFSGNNARNTATMKDRVFLDHTYQL